jgi:hypothetical protein
MSPTSAKDEYHGPVEGSPALSKGLVKASFGIWRPLSRIPRIRTNAGSLLGGKSPVLRLYRKGRIHWARAGLL